MHACVNILGRRRGQLKIAGEGWSTSFQKTLFSDQEETGGKKGHGSVAPQQSAENKKPENFLVFGI